MTKFSYENHHPDCAAISTIHAFEESDSLAQAYIQELLSNEPEWAEMNYESDFFCDSCFAPSAKHDPDALVAQALIRKRELRKVRYAPYFRRKLDIYNTVACHKECRPHNKSTQHTNEDYV